MKNNFYVKVFCFLAFLTLFVSCKQQPEITQTSFETMKITKSDCQIDLPFAAKITGKQDVIILPQVTGTIVGISAHEGQRVVKGQVLFSIDPTPYLLDVHTAEANTEAAKAQVATAKLNFESNKALYDKAVVSRHVLETAENSYYSAVAALAQAKAIEEHARNDFNHCTIVSPVTGTIGLIPYRVGDLVNPSIATPLTIVSDDDYIVAAFSVNEIQYTDIKKYYMHSAGNATGIDSIPPVRLKLKDGSIYESTGKVTSMTGVVDKFTGSVVCKAEYPNKDHILSSGLSATVLLPYVFEDVIIIPQTATMQLQDKRMVYKVEKDGTAKCTIIEVTDVNNGKEYIVTSGLEEGDEIVTSGVTNIQDGQKVKF